MKLNFKIGLLAAVLAMAVNTPQMSAQSKVGSPSYIGTNYTELIAFSNPVNGSDCYLGYDNQSGNWESGTITGLGVNQVLPPGQSGLSGWSSMSSFNVGSYMFWVQYNSTNGKLQINQMLMTPTTCGSINTVVDTFTQSGLSQIVALNVAENTPVLMAYNSGGDIQFYTIGIDPSGIPSSVDLVSSYPLEAGYTILMPYYNNGLPYFIAYNPSGAVKGKLITQWGPATVYTSNWGPNWTALVPELKTLKFSAYTPVTPPGAPVSGGAFANDTIFAGSVNNVVNNYYLYGQDPNYSLFAPFFFTTVDTSNPFVPGFISYRADGQIQVWLF